MTGPGSLEEARGEARSAREGRTKPQHSQVQSASVRRAGAGTPGEAHSNCQRWIWNEDHVPGSQEETDSRKRMWEAGQVTGSW